MFVQSVLCAGLRDAEEIVWLSSVWQQLEVARRPLGFMFSISVYNLSIYLFFFIRIVCTLTILVFSVQTTSIACLREDFLGGEFFLVRIEDLRTEGVVCCKHC